MVLHLLDKKVDCLVTLVPKNFDDYSFKAHPIYFIREQAKNLALSLFIEVEKPYDQGYKQAFNFKKNITSDDIEYIGYSNNIIENSCQDHNLKFIWPLWKKERLELMNKILFYKIQAQITWSNDLDQQKF